jgi:Kef-type K+ transport system membrane component KefB
MKGKIISVVTLIALMALIKLTGVLPASRVYALSLNLGFILLIGYITGDLVKLIGLPKITGYMIVGLIFGPYFFKLLSIKEVENLDFLNGLALAYISFCAGAELKYGELQKKLKSIIYLISGVTLIVFMGVSGSVFLLLGFIHFLGEISISIRIAVSALFGVIAVARSPSSAIAILKETKSRGHYSDIILSVSIAMDVLIIIVFAIVVSLSEMVITGGSGKGLGVSFVFELLFEILIAFIIGFILGKGIVYLINKIKIEFPVVIVIMGFIVIKFSHYLADSLKDLYEIGLNIEPLLICMAAGFTVQNFSSQGDRFIKKLDSISLPIYISFFVIIGASININILKKSWMIGFVVFLVRAIMIFIGSKISAGLAGESGAIRRNAWLGFITQAGVSLGLLAEIGRRFPEFGVSIQTVLIATIAMNQVFGPIAFKYGLKKTGDIGRGK